MSKPIKKAKAPKNNKSKKQSVNTKGLFLITRKGLEKCELQKSAPLCHVVKRKNGKIDYCYKTRFITNPNAQDVEMHGIKK